ncbi:MAG: MBOAT family protein [Lachnospiraceae bacterium]|nr:MBOAT family protein [Lachnospiraceae bacterium]
MDLKYFTECILEWWGQLSYTVWMYFALLLPLTALIYQAAGKKNRRYVLLAASWFFFFSLSGILLIANILTSAFVWVVGNKLESVNADKSIKRKARKKKKKQILVISVVLLLLVLVIFKYLDFLGLNIVRITQIAGIPFDWKVLGLAVPVGISYYTLEAIAYLSDVYWEKTEAEKSFLNVALFMSFFPKLIEGPITRYGGVPELFAGDGLVLDNVAYGYQRILWGLFKKLVIADQLAPAVNSLYDGDYMDGGVALFAALAFTIQEYMDFSGAIDIVIGSARIFNVKLAENFRQPFFAKNASDFWRRWHITLGAFFRDYIFYPISLSKNTAKLSGKVKKVCGASVGRFVTPAISLFFVWLSNGLWHGPRWTYVFYGMYYFVLILIENIVEEPFLKLLERLKLKETSAPVRVFRYVKLLFIVMIGEMIFRAESLSKGFDMLKCIFTDLRFDVMAENLENIGIDRYGYIPIIGGLIVVMIVETLKEIGVPLRAKLQALPVPVRFGFWYVCIFVVIIFGAYGTGYDVEDLIYAQF